MLLIYLFIYFINRTRNLEEGKKKWCSDFKMACACILLKWYKWNLSTKRFLPLIYCRLKQMNVKSKSVTVWNFSVYSIFLFKAWDTLGFFFSLFCCRMQHYCALNFHFMKKPQIQAKMILIFNGLQLRLWDE